MCHWDRPQLPMSAKRSGYSRQPIGFLKGAGTCASSNCSLYTTNGMFQTCLKPVDTNRCVCKYPKAHGNGLRFARVIGPLYRSYLLSDLRTSPPIKRSQMPQTGLLCY
ncbi:hypothetical protein AVEN_51720-1 [Araneus ventricosus]|uniref:Uncharacterized protein n=1 Tax=Araneus ventricosus TaxID=182803 RepID=A0A4Y2GHN8_ARAVE|nr:hypothetical protein AVEN_51720-1 [Araneus ventricosus]